MHTNDVHFGMYYLCFLMYSCQLACFFCVVFFAMSEGVSTCVNGKVSVLLSQPLSKNIEVLFGSVPKPLLKQNEVCD